MDLPDNQLVDNYLNAIRWNLPRGSKRDDIIHELRDVIASRIEDREEALGRPLDTSEVSTLLRDFGHPLIVAARYGMQHSLIGPDLFPFYWFALKVVLVISLVVQIAGGWFRILSSQNFSGENIARSFDGTWQSLLANVAMVTIAFAVIERSGWLTKYLADWKPEQLPDLTHLKVKRKSMWEGVFEIAAGVAFLMWWAGVFHLPIVSTNTEGLSVAPAPIWAQYYWVVFALLAARLVMNVVQLFRPRWTTVHALATVVLAVAGIALLVPIYRAGDWVVITSTTMRPDQLADLQRSLHLSLQITIVVVGVVWIGHALGALWRLYLAKRG